MTALERRSVGLLSSMYALRLAGMFLIFPVFAVYATTLSGYSVRLVGWALGAYGLTQAILQIPFGIWSDRIGRKPVIAFGLVVFAIGSAVAAMSTSIWGVIVGRALQGAGAIAGPVMAMLADLTREEQRTKAMAVIGITIGVSLVASIVLGPIVNQAVGVPGIFWITAVGSVIALGLLLLAMPSPDRAAVGKQERGLKKTLQVIRDPQLARLNIGIFVVHLVFTAMFLVLPHVLVEQLQLPLSQHWELYLPVVLGSLVVAVPALAYSSHDLRTRPVFVGAVAVLVAAELLLAGGYSSTISLIVGLVIFFSAFNLLEAVLPSLVSRLAPAHAKGAALGVYGTSQFLGTFVGGWLGAEVFVFFGVTGVFAFAALSAAVWWGFAYTAPRFKLLSTRTVHVGKLSPAAAKRMAHDLLSVRGVAEAVLVANEGTAYLKVDAASLDEAALNRCLPSG